MDFETATKGANPFLMEDLTDYTSATQLGGGGLNSNPFLSNSDFNIPSSSENPFLSSISGVEISDEASSSPFSATPSGTNPFASFVPDYSESNTGIDLFGSTNGATVSSEETITSSNIYTNIFSDNTIEPLVTSAEDFFSNIPTSVQATTIQPQALESKQLGGIALLDDAHTTFTESVDDFCKETSDIFSSGVIAEHSSSRTSTPKGGGPPRRPPPPRPPPSQETKNLILSVTGAMEATSSHLLDRLKATRTPSPTPIRDLHSPSPTPDMQFSDLLGDDTTGMTTGTLPAFPSRTELNFLEDTEEAIISNVPPGPPQPPPRPGRPPAQPFAQKPVQTNQDIMDIFSSEAQSQPVGVENTNTDFLGLFDSTPSQISAPPTSAALTESGTTDFLFGDAFGDAGGVKEISTAQEVNFMSSPAGLTDLTSDPDAVDLAPTQTDNFSSNIDNFSSNIDNFSSNINNFSSNIDNFSSNFNNFSSNIDNLSSNINNVSSVPTKHGVSDDFDAFSAKFDSAVKEDAVAEDPFDPFASSLGTSGSEMAGDEGERRGQGPEFKYVWGHETCQLFQQFMYSRLSRFFHEVNYHAAKPTLPRETSWQIRPT
uniref:(California timema) hypothetical protein n=1 Tax=Timema californicum TaxID=61474 RepID=A0A7R9PDK3_TIMCA|nr:unnamed protein product [Timema californicum]